MAWIAWLSLPVLLILTIELEHPSLSTLAHVTASGWAALAFTALAASLIAHSGYFWASSYPSQSLTPFHRPQAAEIGCAVFDFHQPC